MGILEINLYKVAVIIGRVVYIMIIFDDEQVMLILHQVQIVWIDYIGMTDEIEVWDSDHVLWVITYHQHESGVC